MTQHTFTTNNTSKPSSLNQPKPMIVTVRIDGQEINFIVALAQDPLTREKFSIYKEYFEHINKAPPLDSGNVSLNVAIYYLSLESRFRKDKSDYKSYQEFHKKIYRYILLHNVLRKFSTKFNIPVTEEQLKHDHLIKRSYMPLDSFLSLNPYDITRLGYHIKHNINLLKEKLNTVLLGFETQWGVGLNPATEDELINEVALDFIKTIYDMPDPDATVPNLSRVDFIAKQTTKEEIKNGKTNERASRSVTFKDIITDLLSDCRVVAKIKAFKDPNYARMLRATLKEICLWLRFILLVLKAVNGGVPLRTTAPLTTLESFRDHMLAAFRNMPPEAIVYHIHIMEVSPLSTKTAKKIQASLEEANRWYMEQLCSSNILDAFLSWLYEEFGE